MIASKGNYPCHNNGHSVLSVKRNVFLAFGESTKSKESGYEFNILTAFTTTLSTLVFVAV